MTRDPYQPDFGDIGNANLYVYCGGDPLNLVDPSGHAGELAGTLGALGILALLSTMVIGTGMSQSLSHVHGVSINLGIRDDINSLLVRAGAPPTQLLIEEEELEPYFLRLIAADGGHAYA